MNKKIRILRTIGAIIGLVGVFLLLGTLLYVVVPNFITMFASASLTAKLIIVGLVFMGIGVGSLCDAGLYLHKEKK